MKKCWKPFIENYKDLIFNSEKKSIEKWSFNLLVSRLNVLKNLS